eukprot:6560930-Pyramimonas_sp.AAC.1
MEALESPREATWPPRDPREQGGACGRVLPAEMGVPGKTTETLPGSPRTRGTVADCTHSTVERSVIVKTSLPWGQLPGVQGGP